MFEKYSYEEMITIDRDDRDDDDRRLAMFIPSHINNEMDPSRDNLVK